LGGGGGKSMNIPRSIWSLPRRCGSCSAPRPCGPRCSSLCPSRHAQGHTANHAHRAAASAPAAYCGTSFPRRCEAPAIPHPPAATEAAAPSSASFYASSGDVEDKSTSNMQMYRSVCTKNENSITLLEFLLE